MAQVVIWIGYLQWLAEHHIDNPKRPILDKLVTIENRDAILDLSQPNLPVPAEWPKADFIVGNPPFLGAKMIRRHLGDTYTNLLFKLYDIPNFSDLCCYWFELSHWQITRHRSTRCGLLATQAIRGGANRVVLDRVLSDGAIFNAWADRNWVLDGATVHVAIVAFDIGLEQERILNGESVQTINSNLSSLTDVASAKPLPEMMRIAFIGTQKSGPFDLTSVEARGVLAEPNVNGKSNFEIVRPWVNGSDLNQRPRSMWIINFPVTLSQSDASQYEAPYKLLGRLVPPERTAEHFSKYPFWILWRPRPDFFGQVGELDRYIATCMVAKHRIFVWVPASTVPENLVIAFVRSDDYFLGALSSSVHENWVRSAGTQLREAESGSRYTPTTTFETFPLPWSPNKEDTKHPAYLRISEAAKKLNGQRERWLNPPEWIDLLSAKIDAADTFEDVPKEAQALVRQSAIMAAAAKDPRLKKRTLTSLYNERPTWLKLAHEELDRAVLAAYAAIDPVGEWAQDWAEVWVDTGAGQPLPADHPLFARRAEIDQKVLANLLRLNHARAKGETATSTVQENSPVAVAPKRGRKKQA